jgi:hypothetical protein
MYTKFDLIRYARIVRGKCYTYAHSEEANETLYYKDDCLHGMCAIASAAYVEYLKRIGIGASCVHTGKHCWVSVGTYFVDLTSSQFGLSNFLVLKKNVFMRLVKRNTCAYSYIAYREADDYKDSFSYWHNGQAPTSKVINRILKVSEYNA